MNDLIREYTFRIPETNRLLRVFSEEPNGIPFPPPVTAVGLVVYYSKLGRDNVIDGEWADTGEVVEQEEMRLMPLVMYTLGRALCGQSVVKVLEDAMGIKEG